MANFKRRQKGYLKLLFVDKPRNQSQAFQVLDVSFRKGTTDWRREFNVETDQ